MGLLSRILPKTIPTRTLRDYMMYSAAAMARRHARPIVSGFPVGLAAIVVDARSRQRYFVSYNVESRSKSGAPDSVHAEEGLVARLRKEEIKGVEYEEKIWRILVLGGLKGQAPVVIPPCGNCRDVLLSHAVRDAEVFVLNESGKGIWFPLTAFLPDVYDKEALVASLKPRDPVLQMYTLVRRLIEGKKKEAPFDPFSKGPRATVMLDEDGAVIGASTIGDAAFHFTESGEVAGGMKDAFRHRKVRFVMFSHNLQVDGPVYPSGRELQKMYQLSQFSDGGLTIISASPNGKLWFAQIDKLLPYAFGPKELGIDVRDYL
ncbi:MAG: hypothetical protein KKA31_05030 [Candidatus Margulisbacteria bacterium]|nr:hypothetical protein [Candidatus Margulisiibacteriota bacterium]